MMISVRDPGYNAKELRRGIIRLAWPSILEQMLIMMVGIVSTIMVGHIGNAAIVAVGLVNMVIMFMQAVFSALSTGSTVLIARLTGEEDPVQARAAAAQSVVIAVGSSLLIMALCYLFAGPILAFFLGSAEADVFAAAQVYYRWTILSLPLLLVNIVVGGAFRGAGDTKTPLYVSLIVNVVNVALSWVLIFGAGSIPPLGILGAALSVMVCRGLGGLIMLALLFWGRAAIRLTVRDCLRIDWPIIRRIFRVGLPASLEQVIMQGGFLLMQVIVVSMGTVAAAVYQVSNSINSIAFMPIFGFAIAVTTLTGQYLGRQDLDMAEQSAKQSLYICLGLITALGAALFIFARPLVALYTRDPEVIALGIVIIRIISLGEPLLAVMNVMSAVLRGAGDIRYIMYTSIASIWCVRIAGTYLLHRVFGVGIVGVWFVIIADFTIRAGLYWLRFKKGNWKYIKI